MQEKDNPPFDDLSQEEQDRKIAEIREAVQARCKAEENQYAEEDSSESKISSNVIEKCYHMGDLGLGILFALKFKDIYFYEVIGKAWYRFNGICLERDSADRVKADVDDIAKLFLEEAATTIPDRISKAVKAGNTNKADYLEKLKNGYLKVAKRLRTVHGRDACLDFAKSNQVLPLTVNKKQFNRDPYLLAHQSGVNNLKTGGPIHPDPDQLITKQCSVPCPDLKSLPTPYAALWRKTLLEIFKENESLVDFLQRLIGLALIGDVIENIFVVCTGSGRNGKGLIFKLLFHLLGSLAGSVQSSMLLDQKFIRNSAAPSPDIMSLHGMRITVASETDENCKVSSAIVKLLTGGDQLAGRNPHDRDETRFNPSHTLFLLTNHKPHAPAHDFAFWERVVLIPFEISFVSRKPQSVNERPADLDLANKLKEEAPEILAWMVEGCLLYQRHGLKPPLAVRQATAEYRRDEDILADFVEECCFIDDNTSVGATDLYSAFEEWWSANVSKKPPSQKWFGMRMKKKFRREKDGRVYRYFGVGLIP